MISISGTPRPVEVVGPGWSEPGQVHADSLCPGRKLRGEPPIPPVAAAIGFPLWSVWFGKVPPSQVS